MKNNDLFQSDIDIFNSEEFDFADSIKVSKEILEEEMKINPDSKLNFDSNKWELWMESEAHYRKIDFDKVYKIVKFNASINAKDFIIVVKCWVANLIYDKSNYYVQHLFRHLVEFMEISKTFDVGMVDTTLDYLELKFSKRKAYEISISALSFIDFYENIDSNYEFGKMLVNIRNNIEFKAGPRSLPPTKEVRIFHKILNHYFNNLQKESSDYLFFYPIYLWWNLTMIIPLRPKEFVKIARDALDDDNYLHLPREKQRNKNLIQVIDRIKIPTNLADNIRDYINKTNNYGETKTLLHPSVTRTKNYDRTVYSTTRHSYILQIFYKEIVGEKYGLTMKLNKYGYPINATGSELFYDITKLIVPGDTRHFSMLNLMRQGYHPLQIARLAGHKSLGVQKNYYGHLEYWTDSATLELVEKITADIEVDNTVTFDDDFKNKFIFKPGSSTTRIPLDLGYCTDPNQNCLVDSHFFCEHYRLTEEEYVTREKDIKQALIQSKLKVKNTITVLTNLQRLCLRETESEVEYSEDDYLIKQDLKEVKNRLDLALHQHSNVKYHYNKSKSLKKR